MLQPVPERAVFIASENIAPVVTPEGAVGVHLGALHSGLGLDADVVLRIELSPESARRVAALLIQRATEAEGVALWRQP